MGTFLSAWRDNPILTRELRGRWIPRTSGGKKSYVPLIVVGVLTALAYFYAISSLFRSQVSGSTSDLHYILRVVELTLILLLLPSFASAAITKEREQQTWNALLLSRLTSWEIVLGKFVGAVAPALFILLLFSPLDIISAALGDVPLFRFLFSTGLLLSIVVFCAALGLFFSWARRRTFQASSSVFGVLAFLTVGTWILFGLFQLSLNSGGMDTSAFFPLWLNPYVALSDSLRAKDEFPFIAVVALILYLVLSAALLWLVTTRLRRGAKELEQ